MHKALSGPQEGISESLSITPHFTVEKIKVLRAFEGRDHALSVFLPLGPDRVGCTLCVQEITWQMSRVSSLQ